MRYHAIIGGRERLVEVSETAGTTYRVAIHEGPKDSPNPRVLEVDAVHLKDNALSLLVGARRGRCDVQAGKDGKLAVLVNGAVHPLELLDERKLRLRQAGGKFSLEGPQRIDAPMPGKIVRVAVKLGDEVTEGQGLVVVEAMKMENELKSPKAGKVLELTAVEGAAVEAGVKLVVIG
jgi:biotin carboxyl carrier protein